MVNQPVLSVPFYEDQVEAILDPTGEVHVVIKRVCENLGVAFQRQLQKLKDYHWAGVTMMVTPDQRGRPQELATLPLSQVSAWLFTIQLSRVAEHLREKIRLYQLEAVDVLYRHFMGGPQASVQPPDDPITAMLEAMLAIRQSQQAQGQQLVQHDGRLGRAETGIIGLKENLTELIEVADENGNKLTTIAAKVDQVIAGQQQPVRVEIVPSTKIPPLTLRARIHQLVNDYVARTQGDYRLQWRRLHDQARYRLHYDVRARARHSGRKSLLDQAEHDGRIVEYYDLACELFNIESFTPTVQPAGTNGVQVNRLTEEIENGES